VHEFEHRIDVENPLPERLCRQVFRKNYRNFRADSAKMGDFTEKVEDRRTFGWFTWYRRLAKDFEKALDI
jgi:hypothetical protein